MESEEAQREVDDCWEEEFLRRIADQCTDPLLNICFKIGL